MDRRFKKVTVIFENGEVMIYTDATITDRGSCFDVQGDDENRRISLTQCTWREVKELELEV